jgi:hypothetical protein
MDYAIDFINDTAPVCDFSEAEMTEFAATVLFEKAFADDMRGCDSEDIGGLIVYACAGEVRAVFDYENMCGWVV